MLAVFFYTYLLIVIVRAGTLAAALGARPAERTGGVGVIAGLVLLYLLAVLPALAAGRPVGQRAGGVLHRFRFNRMAVAGLALLLALVSMSLLAPLITGYDPVSQNPVIERYQSPTFSHPFGTDKFGRDLWSRVVYGSQVSLAVGVLAVVLASLLGLVVGAFSGYAGGWVDEIVMRVVDGLLAFPRLLFILTLLAFFANSFALVVVMIAATSWMGVARLVRAEVLTLNERDFIRAAVVSGAGRAGVVWRHLVPNSLGPVIVTASLRIGTIILLESYLSFLGLGVQPPTPSWGAMVFEGRDVLLSAWWVSAFPGLAIVLAVVACNLVGDGLRDAMDVRTG